MIVKQSYGALVMIDLLLGALILTVIVLCSDNRK